jgi:hypothetical protein
MGVCEEGRIEWRTDGGSTPEGDVRVDRGRADVPVTGQRLDRTDIVSSIEQVGGEGIPEGVTEAVLRDAGGARGLSVHGFGGCIEES